MKKQHVFILSLILIFFISACNSKKADDKSFVIHGKLTDSKQDSIFLNELSSKDMIPVDSTVINADGEFYFKVQPKETGFYQLGLSNNNFITLLIEKGENVEIEGNATLLKSTYLVKGSKGSELIRDLSIRIQEAFTQVDSLGKIYEKSKGEPDILKVKESLDSAYLKIFDTHKNYLKSFIDENTSSLASVIAIYQRFGRESIFNTQTKEDIVYFEKLDKALMLAYPENQHTKDLHEKIAEYRKIEEERKLAENKLAVGLQAPDFTLETPEGKSVSLSSLKGKVVLIDFWASWCSPCRQLNPEMVKLYKKFKDKNFTILGVSLDRDKASWEKAIKIDKLTWTHVSDLKYWDSPVAKLYNVQSIPYSVLINKEGKIVAKGLEVDSLRLKMEEIIK